MKARLEKSKKWSSLPEELLIQIKDIFTETFSSQLGESKVISEGRIYSSEILFRIGIGSKDRLKQHNFEASMDYNKSKDNVMSLVHIAVDAVGSMLSEFLKDESTDFPHDWQKFDIEKREIYLKYSTDNSNLELKADKLLGLADDSLVQGDDGANEVKLVKKIIGVDDK